MQQKQSESDGRILLNTNPTIQIQIGVSDGDAGIMKDLQESSVDATKFNVSSVTIEEGTGIINLGESVNLAKINLDNDRLSLQSLNEFLNSVGDVRPNLLENKIKIGVQPDAERKYTGLKAKLEEFRLNGIIGIEIPDGATDIVSVQRAFNENMQSNLKEDNKFSSNNERLTISRNEGKPYTIGDNGERFDKEFASDIGVDSQNFVYTSATKGRVLD